MKRVIIIILLIISFFNILTLRGYCATVLPTSTDVVDTSQNVYNIYNGFNNDMLQRLYRKIVKGNENQLENIIELLVDGTYSYFITYNTQDGQNMESAFSYNQSALYIIFYKKSGITRTSPSVDNWAGIPTQTTYLSLTTSNSEIFYIQGQYSNINQLTSYSNFNLYMPVLLYNYTPDNTISFLNSITSGTEEQGLLQQIAQNSKKSSDEAKATNDFLNNKNVDNNSYNQSSTNIPDSSSSDLTGAFTTLKNVFTNNQSVDIVIPIPYSEENLTIPSNMTVTMLGQNGQFLVDLVALIFNFALATFIVKDVNKYITRLKDGSIVEGTDTNIKADML